MAEANGDDTEAPTGWTREQLARYLSGDPDASRRLFEVHREFLVGRAAAGLRGKTLAGDMTEEDLVSEVFLRALASRLFHRFRADNPGALRAALSAILSRVLIDCHRKASAVKRSPKVLPALGHDETPTSQARAAELVDLCRRVLPTREWNVWRLSAIEGLDSSEIAERSGDSDAAVRGLLHRARARIVRELATPENQESGAGEHGPR